MGDERPSLFPATSAPLMAASFLLEKECKGVNDSFMVCRHHNDDPTPCREFAQSVMDCTSDLFTKLRQSPCRTKFEQFWKCLDMNNQDHIYCRVEEFAFYDCTKEHLGNTKQLWRSYRPERGLKEEHDRPEIDSWRYQMHVWSHKNSIS